MNIFGNTGVQFIKSIGVHGAPGSGKSFVTHYSCLYAISKGVRVISTSIMSRRSVHLGGLYLHKLFSLDVNNNISPQRMAESSFIKLLQDPTKLNALQVVNIVFLDEAGQLFAELLSVLDIVLYETS